MHLPPFQLDLWLSKYKFASPPIRYDLASSTGPRWTVRDVLALGGDGAGGALESLTLSYLPSAGSAALRRRIGELDGVDPDWVVVTTGASEAMLALMCLVAEPGASVLLPSPAFPAFEAHARAWGLGVKTYALARERGFAHTARAIAAAADDTTRLVVVNSPHNPSGAVMPADEIAALGEMLAARGALLAVDEVYHPLYHPIDLGAPAPSAARLPNTVAIGDMSKALSLGGLRIGWIVDRDAHRREQLIQARGYFTISGSPVTEALAEIALAAADRILARAGAVVGANLAALERLIDAHAETLAWFKPAGGTTAFPWFTDGRDARPFAEALAAEGVLVTPGDCFGAPDHFRVGLGAEPNAFADALAIVSRTLESRGGRG
jgi:aspartate/methionine/tyrosine aminotransferase